MTQRFDVSSSLRKKEPKNKLKNGIQIRSSHNDIDIHAHDVFPPVLFLKESLTSYNIKELKFTNCLPSSYLFIKPFITEGVNNLVSNYKNIIRNSASNTGIDLTRNNGPRIKKIFKTVLGSQLMDKFSDSIREHDVPAPKSQIDSRGLFRMFSIYGVKDAGNIEREQQWIGIFLLDPYHLVCLENKQLRDENYIKNHYEVYASDSDSFEHIFNTEFQKLDFVSTNDLI